eukprot:TRINITY_DN45298_c0_g1_i2.p1 TRINITY_DN45298_c0_g1~~TRINITY_DN45298_c0_g1_i2.p1  ORF type:complete len:373 (-),score=86.93 TRINITY_DN45298_c0_g1_i2:528-1646(-)
MMPQLDAILVELSGVAEPRAAKRVMDELLYTPPAHIARTVAVVDTPAFATDYDSALSVVPDLPAGDERLSALLAEQVEVADLVVMNKRDMATDTERRLVNSMVTALNPGVEMREVEHGRVGVSALIPDSLLKKSGVAAGEAPSSDTADHGCGFAHEHGPDCSHGHDSHGHGHSHTHSHSHTDAAEHRSTAERRFGITSFVYSSDRPLDKSLFLAQLQNWQQSWQQMGRILELREDSAPRSSDDRAATPDANDMKLAPDADAPTSPFAPVLRSKGLLWLDTQPGDALYWSHAGRCVRISNWGPWGETAEKAATEEGHIAASAWPPRTELVFIGARIDETAVRKALDACLVPEADTEKFRAVVTAIGNMTKNKA